MNWLLSQMTISEWQLFAWAASAWRNFIHEFCGWLVWPGGLGRVFIVELPSDLQERSKEFSLCLNGTVCTHGKIWKWAEDGMCYWACAFHWNRKPPCHCSWIQTSPVNSSWQKIVSINHQYITHFQKLMTSHVRIEKQTNKKLTWVKSRG